MSVARDRLVRDAAARGKYSALYRHLLSVHPEPEWRTTFGEVEAILGFRLPDSARLHRPWWSNSRKGSGHSHAFAWQAAGWRTREVDMRRRRWCSRVGMYRRRRRERPRHGRDFPSGRSCPRTTPALGPKASR